MTGLRAWCDRYELPTWLLAAIIYLAWFALTWCHARIAWWLIVPLGAVIVAWHASLQHETIHALVRVPRRMRTMLAWPPLGLGYPYAISYREHRKHHRDGSLTHPLHDPESFYHPAERWHEYHPAVRAVLFANQTVLGRLTLGVPLRLGALALDEMRRLRAGDYSNVRDWLWHAASVGVLFGWICGVAHMPPWQYVGFVALPGLCLGMLRTFIEHRAAFAPAHRTAIVENDFPLGLLFLYNNLHAVHHQKPSLPWYKIRAEWKAHRAEILARNGNFYFTGYCEVVRRWLVRPVFSPSYDASPARACSAEVRANAG